jgi:hypothetical protein
MEDDVRDFATDEHYCIHGTYIGTWCGPDYICGWCEEGWTVAEMREAHEAARLREIDSIERNVELMLTNCRRAARDHRERAGIMCKLVPYVDEHFGRKYLALTGR